MNQLDQVKAVRSKIEQLYKDSTELFPDFSSYKKIEVIKSPSTIMNAVTGVGGFPRGRVTEIHGPFSSGKTTIAIEVCAEAQKISADSSVLYLDYEHAFDAIYAHNLGLDLNPDRFIFAQPEYFEQGAAIVDEFLDKDLVDIVVVDSCAAMTPRAELEGEWDKEAGSQKALQALLMARFLGKVTKKLSKGRKPALVLINQTRAFMDMSGRRSRVTEQPAGGNAIKFYSSIRLKLEPLAPEGEENRGSKGTDQVYTKNRVRITGIKNKLAPPFIRGSIVIEYGKGINNVASIAELAEAKLGIMSGAGFFKYDGETKETSFSCRGRQQFIGLLEKTPALKDEIEGKVLLAIKDDNAKALGLSEIKEGGKAKTVQSVGISTISVTSDAAT